MENLGENCQPSIPVFTTSVRKKLFKVFKLMTWNLLKFVVIISMSMERADLSIQSYFISSSRIVSN